MAQLPTPGQDEGVWGDMLNEFLQQSHAADGTLKTNSVTNNTIADGAITNAKISSSATITSNKLSTAVQTSLGKADGALQTSLATAKGDLLAASAANTMTRLGVGNNGQVLVANAAQTMGIEWKTLPTNNTIAVAPPTGVAATDTTAIQAAITAAQTAGGGTIELAAGTYLVTPNTLLNPSYVSWRGQGREVTFIKKAANGLLLNVSGASDASRNGFMTFTELTFNGDNRTGDLVKAYYVHSIVFDRVYFQYNDGQAIDFVNAWDCWLTNVFMQWVTGSNTAGTGDTPGNLHLRNSGAASGMGFSAGQTNMIWLLNCRFENFKYTAISIENGTGWTSGDYWGIYATHIKAETSVLHGTPISVNGGRHIHFDKWEVVSNSFDNGYSSAGNAIFWAPYGNSSLRNGRIYQSGTQYFYNGINAYLGTLGPHTIDNIHGDTPSTSFGGGVVNLSSGWADFHSVAVSTGPTFGGSGFPSGATGGSPTVFLRQSSWYDEANGRIYFRKGDGTWHYTTLT